MQSRVYSYNNCICIVVVVCTLFVYCLTRNNRIVNCHHHLSIYHINLSFLSLCRLNSHLNHQYLTPTTCTYASTTRPSSSLDEPLPLLVPYNSFSLPFARIEFFRHHEYFINSFSLFFILALLLSIYKI